MRVMASHPTIHSGLFPASRPTRVPLPAPEPSSPLASAADWASASEYDRRASPSTAKSLSPNRSAHHRTSSPLVGVKEGKLVVRVMPPGALRDVHEAGEVPAHHLGNVLVGEALEL